MRGLLVLVIVASGCGVVAAPGSAADPIEQWLEGSEVAEPANARAAVDLVLMSYKASTGAGARMPEVLVRWWSGDLLPIDGQRATGIMISCDRIWVWTDQRSPLGRSTPLAHELGHCIRGQLTGDPDPSHADDAWWGYNAPVGRALSALQASGL